MIITEYQRLKVADYLRREQPRRVCLIFWHGLGDLVMFLTTFHALRHMFPGIQIDIALQNGTGQEALAKDAVLIGNPNKPVEEYDYTFQIHYPMSEHMNGRWTKNEWCCLRELGIDPISSYPRFKRLIGIKRLRGKHMVAVHFQATALPGPCNPTEEVAYEIWREIEQAGFMPIEAFFRHAWHNPVNEKFDFIPEKQTVRGISASIPKLVKLLQSCYASICIASGNLPLSLAIMPGRTSYLQKEYPIGVYTKKNIISMDVRKYRAGEIREWLKTL